MIDAFLTQRPQTKRQLSEKSGFPIREVELLVHAARLEGVPIISDSDGYRLSRDPAEVAQCAARLRTRAIHQLLTARALRRAARRIEEARIEQGVLWAA